MRYPIALTVACVLAALLTLAGGCVVDKREYDSLANELAESKASVRKLKQDTEGLQAVVTDQQKQIQALQELGERRLERLFHVQWITLGRYTGGVDLDGKPGDDGIKVYLHPADQDGSIIKAAGKVRIQLFDLAAEPKDNLIAQYEWPPEKLSKQWASGFMAYHFSFECPWKSAENPPRHDEITVRVEFIDYLTGKAFAAQKLCKVQLPPKQPAQNQEPATTTPAK